MGPRQAGMSVPPATLSNAIKAILGASWLDSGEPITVVTEIVGRLG